MLTGKQFVVAINEGGVGGQNYGNNCRKQNVLATASVGLQHQQNERQRQERKGRGLWLKRHIQWQQEALREIANKPQSATATNDEADKKCVDSSFSTMGIVLGIRVKEGWKDRRGGRGSLSWFVRHGYRLFLSILKSS